MLLLEDPPSTAAGCITNLSSAAGSPLQPPRTATTFSSSSMAPPPPASPASPPPRARLTSGMRLYRCEHLCSDAVSRTAGSPCPCASCGPGSATRTTELHFLEAVFFKRADGSSVTTASRRGGGRSGDTFYRCHSRHGGRDVHLCRGRVTDERGVVCLTTVTIKLAKGGDVEGASSATQPPRAAHGLGYAIMDDLAVRNVDGLSRAALLAELGVAEDLAAVREVIVPLGYKQGLSILWTGLRYTPRLF